MKERLLQTRCWVFDLDNTLYPPQSDLFAQIDVLMTRFVANYLNLPKDQARIVQKKYYAQYGTTLNGLMQEHGMQPGNYLDFVHDIDVSVLRPDRILRATIDALPGRKMVFTNGSTAHALRVLAARGLDGIFETIIDIEATCFVPKPRRAAYQHLIDAHHVKPQEAVMVEDLARNLKPAYDLGFITVLVHSDKDWSHEPEAARPAAAGETHAHVHFTTGDLSRFLHDHVIAPIKGLAKDLPPMSKREKPAIKRPDAETTRRALDEAERRNQHAVAEEETQAKEPVKELGGPKGLEPTRFGDWERKGLISDF